MTEDFNINERMHLANEQFTADMKKADSWQKSYGDLVKNPEYLEMRTALDEHGVKGLEPFVAQYRITAINNAKNGDVTELASLVREGKILNKEERSFVADLMLGKIKKPAHRTVDQSAIQEISLAMFWLHEVDGMEVEPAVAKCRELFMLSRSQVYERKSQGKLCILTQEAIAQRRIILKNNINYITIYFKLLDLKSG